MRLTKIPRGARHLRTYAEFESYLSDFVTGRFQFLWVVGRPGTAKTESVRAAIRGRKAYYRTGGQLTPLQFYLDCYYHRGQPIILDDAEHLLDGKLGSKLVSALGDTTQTRQLCYGSTSRALGDVPHLYHTTSPLCIIANRVTAHEAIRSRAVVLYFDPTSREIHEAVARWYWDQEIHDWFGQHLHRLSPLDSRWYRTASDDKGAGRDWQRIILDAHSQGRPCCLVQDLETDPAYPTREDKASRFAEQMAGTKGASRATYFRLRKHLEEEGRLEVRAVPPIALGQKERPAAPSLADLDAMMTAPPTEADDDDEAVQPVDVPVGNGYVTQVCSPALWLAQPPWDVGPHDDGDENQTGFTQQRAGPCC
jgi:hypothetical protein